MDVQRQRQGARIKQARKDAGLSHDRLAEKVGTSRQHLIRLEKGVHAPREKLLERIAEATGKPLSHFNGDEEEEDESDVVSDLHRVLHRLVKQAVAQAVAGL